MREHIAAPIPPDLLETFREVRAHVAEAAHPRTHAEAVAQLNAIHRQAGVAAGNLLGMADRATESGDVDGARVALDERRRYTALREWIEELWVPRRPGSAETGAARATMRLAVCGPNLPGGGATFHVHAADCADLRRKLYQGDPPYVDDFASRVEVCDAMYPPEDFGCESGEHLDHEFRFFPCCAELPRR